jgi:hypothetical protein
LPRASLGRPTARTGWAQAPGPGSLAWRAFAVDGHRGEQLEAPEYVEEELSPFGELVEHRAEMLGLDHARAIAERGMEAGE